MRKTILALAFAILSAAPALAAPCGPIPSLPDTERRTEYTGVSASTGPFAVNFQIYGDSTDYGNWLEVWVNGVKKTAVTDWTLATASGPAIGSTCLPITNAQVTFLAAQTGTIEIVGARRPRRASQFSENRGVTAHDLNQVISDMVASQRERWDSVGRLLRSPPAETLSVLPSAANRANKYLFFDNSGQPQFTATAPPTPSAPIVILATGQSNFSTSRTFTWVPNPNCKIWNWDGVDTHIGTAFVAPSSTTVAVADRFCSSIADLNPGRQVYLVNISIASQPIAQWMVGAGAPDMFQNILNNIVPALAAISATKIDVELWWQGEADALASSTTYTANRETVDARFRAQSWFPVNTPVVLFGISSAAQSGTAWSDNINGALKAFAANASDLRKFVYPNTFTGATYWADSFHMTGVGYDVVGVMAANEFMRGVGRSVLRNVVVDETTGNFGIGTAVPKVPLQVSKNASDVPTFAPGNTTAIAADICADNTLGCGRFLDSYSGTTGAQVGSYYFFRAANGTAASPSALATNSQIGGFRVYGHNGTGFQQSAAFLATATENFSSGHIGSSVDLYSTPNGGSITNTLRLDGVGTILRAGDAIPAGGTQDFGYRISSTAHFGTFVGSGAPTLSAAKGSIYMRSDGDNYSRGYINTDGGTTYQPIATLNAVAFINVSVSGVNFNSANTDTQISFSLPPGFTRYRVLNVAVSGASASISTATAGLFTASGGGGTAIVTGGSAITVTSNAEDTNNNMMVMTLNNSNTQSHNETTLFWRVATPQGSAATANVSIVIQPVS